MLKRSLLFLGILLIMIFVIPQIAQPAEKPENLGAESKSNVGQACLSPDNLLTIPDF